MSPMKTNFLKFLIFGLIAGLIFPFYANLFVQWKPGMLKFFITGCIFAGIFVGIGNFLVFRSILKKLNEVVRFITIKKLGIDINRNFENTDLYDKFHHQFIYLIKEVNRNNNTIKRMISQLTTGIIEMRDIISETNNLAKSSSLNTTSTSNIAKTGEQQIKNTFEGCKDINNHLANSLEKMKNFEKTFYEIVKESQNIEILTTQTEILGTNASITAAKAGVQGAAFGVVAQEIKKLATQSRESTDHIMDLIKNTKNEISYAFNAMETASIEFKKQSESFNKTSKHLIKINDSAQKNIIAINEIIEKLENLNELSIKVEKGF